MPDQITLEYNGTTYANWEADALRDVGVPQAAIDEAVLRLRREVAAATCRDRIYAVADAETQLNMTSFVTAIGLKTASARTEDERSAAAAFIAALGWVELMRAQVGVIAADIALDPSLDASWPACPPDVVALARRF